MSEMERSSEKGDPMIEQRKCEHVWNYSKPNTSGAIFPICIKCGYVEAPIYKRIGQSTAGDGSCL